MRIYDFKVKTTDGSEVCLSDYKDKVVLIINSATGCGFTPQYEDLQCIYEKYKERAFIILDFPCNQFANQAPGSNEEIVDFCNARYGITFPIFAKIEVNGKNAEPLFSYLKSQQGFQASDKGNALAAMAMKMLGKKSKAEKNDIKWNFTKFLIDRNGSVVARFEPTAGMKTVEERIGELL